MDVEVAYQNYDVGFKSLFSLFRNYSLSFLGLDNAAPVASLLDGQLPKLEAREGECDTLFGLTDDSILHIEDEVELSVQDLCRFAGYDLAIYTKYGKPIRTVVIVHETSATIHSAFDIGAMRYKVEVVDLSSMDGETMYAKLRWQIAAGHPINPLELAYMPLMRNEVAPEVAVKRTLDLVAQTSTLGEDERRELLAGIFVLSVKLIDEEKLNQWLEGFAMSENMKIFIQKLQNIGRDEGIEQGREQVSRDTALLMLGDNEPLLKIQKYTRLPPETIYALAQERRLKVNE